jgi:hypothetical protein
MIIEKGIDEEIINDVIQYSYTFFSHIIGESYFYIYISAEAKVNWSKSALLIDDEGFIRGVYLIGKKQLPVKLERYSNKVGVEGVLLAIDEDIRGQGWGNKLKDYPKTLGVDYIWGQQFKNLNNLNDWLKRRELISSTDEVYITAEIF